MRKKTIAFYDVLLYTIICGPMIVIAIMLLFMLVTRGTSNWIYKNWYLVIIFGITFMVPYACVFLFKYILVTSERIYFHYFPFTKSWKKGSKKY